MGVLVEGPGGVRLWLPLPLSFPELHTSVTHATGVPASEQRAVCGTRSLREGDVLTQPGRVVVGLRLCGGKGGFGSLLRTLGNKRSGAETDNIDACRDLSGRRLKHVKDEKAVREWLANAPQRAAESEQRRKEKLDRLMSVPKHAFDHHSFTVGMEEANADVDTAVAAGIKAASAAATSKPGAGAQPKPKRSKFVEDFSTDDVSSTDDEGILRKSKATPAGIAAAAAAAANTKLKSQASAATASSTAASKDSAMDDTAQPEAQTQAGAAVEAEVAAEAEDASAASKPAAEASNEDNNAADNASDGQAAVSAAASPVKGKAKAKRGRGRKSK